MRLSELIGLPTVEISGDLHSGILPSMMESDFMAEVKKAGKIVLLISSGGGSTGDSSAIAHCLRMLNTMGIHTIAVGHGRVMSAALDVFLHCHTRLGFSGTVFMAHKPYFSNVNEVDMNELDFMKERMVYMSDVSKFNGFLTFFGKESRDIYTSGKDLLFDLDKAEQVHVVNGRLFEVS